MAQETRIAPIEFDRTPTQVLLNIGEQKRQEQMLRQREAAEKQKLAFEQYKYMRGIQDEEMKRRYENQKDFNTLLQNKDWSKEATSQYLSNTLKEFANAKDSDSFEYRNRLGKRIGEISEYNRYVNSIYDNADKYVGSLPPAQKAGFDAAKFKNDYIQNALFKEGRQKSLDELRSEASVNWMEETFKNGKERYFDVNVAYNNIPKLIKEAPTGTVQIPKGRTSLTVQYRPEFEVVDKATGNVKLRTDEFGYIDTDVYNRLISDPAIDALATRDAKKFIQNYNTASKEDKLSMLGANAAKAGNLADKDNDGLPDVLTEADMDLVKKGFMTRYINNQIPEYSKTPQESKGLTVNIGGGIGGGKGFIDAYKDLDDMATKKFNEGKYLQVNLTQDPDLIVDYAKNASGVKNLNQSNIKIIKDKEGRTGIYAADDIVGSEQTEEFPLGKPYYKKNGLIVYINRDKFNILANEKLGLDTKKTSASSPEPKKMMYNEKTGKFE